MSPPLPIADPPGGPGADRRGSWPFAAGLALGLAACVAWALLLSANVPRSDDLVYVDWARSRSSPLAFVTAPPPYPGVRPLNALIWQGGVALGGAWAGPVALAEALLWLGAVGAWVGWAGARGGRAAAAWTLAFLVACAWFRDLPTWRSWMTSTGALALLGAGLWALEVRRPWTAVALGVLAAGFKENAVLVLAGAAWLVHGRRLHAALLAAAVLPGALAFGRGAEVFAPTRWLDHALAYGELVAGSLWVPVLAVGAAVEVLRRRPALSAWAPWALVMLGSAALPLLYGPRNPVYLLEGTLIGAVLAASALARGTLPAAIGVAALALALPTLGPSFENAGWQRGQWSLARRVLAERAEGPPGTLHLADDAHDGGRFVAFWLERERGWVACDAPREVGLGHGLTATPGEAGCPAPR